MPKPGQC